MARKKASPADSLGRFIFGIYDYYHDRGMPQKTAKARMIDDTLETVSDIMKKEDEIPDHMLVLMAQWMSKSLNARGAQMTKTVRETDMEAQHDTDAILQPLRDIKAAKDAIDVFIETYKGWSDLDGTKKES